MDDKVIDITKHLGKRNLFKKRVSREINFFLLEKLSKEIPEVKSYIKHLIEYAKESCPGKVEKVIRENSRDMLGGEGLGLEDVTHPEKSKEFIKIFLKSPYLREIILDEYYLVLKPLFAEPGGFDFDGDAVSAN